MFLTMNCTGKIKPILKNSTTSWLIAFKWAMVNSQYGFLLILMIRVFAISEQWQKAKLVSG